MTAPDLGKHTEGLIGYECSPPLAALYNQVTKGATNNGGPGYYFRKRFNANCEKKLKNSSLQTIYTIEQNTMLQRRSVLQPERTRMFSSFFKSRSGLRALTRRSGRSTEDVFFVANFYTHRSVCHYKEGEGQMRINNNIMALNAHRQLAANQADAAKAMEKLSSGYRINRAGDDAAGLAISEKMRGQIRGLKQASRNAQDGISLIQTAEGALNETHAILQRMRELAVQAATDTMTTADRIEIQKEIDQLAAEIDRIAETTQFNTQNLLDGDFKAKFHVGANEDQNVELAISAMDAKTLEVGYGELVAETEGSNDILVGDDDFKAEWEDADEEAGTVAGYYDGDNLVYAADKALEEGAKVNPGLDLSTREAADKAVSTVNTALEAVSSERSLLGAMQNRLEHTIANLGTAAENLQAAESRIRDLDMAEEIMTFTKNSILQQAATAMLAQANMSPQSVLQLLG